MGAMARSHTHREADHGGGEDEALTLSQGLYRITIEPEGLIALDIDLLALTEQELPGTLQCPFVQLHNALRGQSQPKPALASAPHHGAKEGFLQLGENLL